MVKILEKELTLSTSPITYYFILFGFLFLLPGYPILCAPFFVTLGIFKSFQNAREANDFVFSALLPIAKRDVVKGKYIFSCLIEVNSLLIMAVSTLIRMSILKDNIVYRTNALMNANLYGLGAALAIFGCLTLSSWAASLKPPISLALSWAILSLHSLHSVFLNRFIIFPEWGRSMPLALTI